MWNSRSLEEQNDLWLCRHGDGLLVTSPTLWQWEFHMSMGNCPEKIYKTGAHESRDLGLSEHWSQKLWLSRKFLKKIGMIWGTIGTTVPFLRMVCWKHRGRRLSHPLIRHWKTTRSTETWNSSTRSLHFTDPEGCGSARGEMLVGGVRGWCFFGAI
jgi:hypothetical protein